MTDERLIDEELAAFLQGAVSMHVASCAPGRAPGLARAMGCRLSGDRRTVTMLVFASQSASMLEDFRANGRIAVVFSKPSTHRTVQLKGRDARTGPAEPDDSRLVGRYRQGFVEELGHLGYDTSLPRTLLTGTQDDLVAVSFTPAEAFVQTPGPGAGAALRAP
jgi:hypothetical protein